MKKFLLFVAMIAITLASCKKEGVGGDASITGSVHVQKWNSTFTQLIGEYPGRDIYVYIVYGAHDGYDKRIKTDYNGRFEFPYLYKGDYTVYTYSRDSTFSDASGTVALVKQVQITDRKGAVELDPFIVFE
jgi:hypothetical protein